MLPKNCRCANEERRIMKKNEPLYIKLAAKENKSPDISMTPL
jgi:hypothetical protein